MSSSSRSRTEGVAVADDRAGGNQKDKKEEERREAIKALLSVYKVLPSDFALLGGGGGGKGISTDYPHRGYSANDGGASNTTSSATTNGGSLVDYLRSEQGKVRHAFDELAKEFGVTATSSSIPSVLLGKGGTASTTTTRRNSDADSEPPFSSSSSPYIPIADTFVAMKLSYQLDRLLRLSAAKGNSTSTSTSSGTRTSDKGRKDRRGGSIGEIRDKTKKKEKDSRHRSSSSASGGRRSSAPHKDEQDGHKEKREKKKKEGEKRRGSNSSADKRGGSVSPHPSPSSPLSSPNAKRWPGVGGEGIEDGDPLHEERSALTSSAAVAAAEPTLIQQRGVRFSVSEGVAEDADVNDNSSSSLVSAASSLSSRMSVASSLTSEIYLAAHSPPYSPSSPAAGVNDREFPLDNVGGGGGRGRSGGRRGGGSSPQRRIAGQEKGDHDGETIISIPTFAGLSPSAAAMRTAASSAEGMRSKKADESNKRRGSGGGTNQSLSPSRAHRRPSSPSSAASAIDSIVTDYKKATAAWLDKMGLKDDRTANITTDKTVGSASAGGVRANGSDSPHSLAVFSPANCNNGGVEEEVEEVEEAKAALDKLYWTMVTNEALRRQLKAKVDAHKETLRRRGQRPSAGVERSRGGESSDPITNTAPTAPTIQLTPRPEDVEIRLLMKRILSTMAAPSALTLPLTSSASSSSSSTRWLPDEVHTVRSATAKATLMRNRAAMLDHHHNILAAANSASASAGAKQKEQQQRRLQQESHTLPPPPLMFTFPLLVVNRTGNGGARPPMTTTPTPTTTGDAAIDGQLWGAQKALEAKERSISGEGMINGGTAMTTTPTRPHPLPPSAIVVTPAEEHELRGLLGDDAIDFLLAADGSGSGGIVAAYKKYIQFPAREGEVADGGDRLGTTKQAADADGNNVDGATTSIHTLEDVVERVRRRDRKRLALLLKQHIGDVIRWKQMKHHQSNNSHHDDANKNSDANPAASAPPPPFLISELLLPPPSLAFISGTREDRIVKVESPMPTPSAAADADTPGGKDAKEETNATPRASTTDAEIPPSHHQRVFVRDVGVNTLFLADYDDDEGGASSHLSMIQLAKRYEAKTEQALEYAVDEGYGLYDDEEARYYYNDNSYDNANINDDASAGGSGATNNLGRGGGGGGGRGRRQRREFTDMAPLVNSIFVSSGMPIGAQEARQKRYCGHVAARGAPCYVLPFPITCNNEVMMTSGGGGGGGGATLQSTGSSGNMTAAINLFSDADEDADDGALYIGEDDGLLSSSDDDENDDGNNDNNDGNGGVSLYFSGGGDNPNRPKNKLFVGLKLGEKQRRKLLRIERRRRNFRPLFQGFMSFGFEPDAPVRALLTRAGQRGENEQLQDEFNNKNANERNPSSPSFNSEVGYNKILGALLMAREPPVSGRVITMADMGVVVSGVSMAAADPSPMGRQQPVKEQHAGDGSRGPLVHQQQQQQQQQGLFSLLVRKAYLARLTQLKLLSMRRHFVHEALLQLSSARAAANSRGAAAARGGVMGKGAIADNDDRTDDLNDQRDVHVGPKDAEGRRYHAFAIVGKEYYRDAMGHTMAAAANAVQQQQRRLMMSGGGNNYDDGYFGGLVAPSSSVAGGSFLNTNTTRRQPSPPPSVSFGSAQTNKFLGGFAAQRQLVDALARAETATAAECLREIARHHHYYYPNDTNGTIDAASSLSVGGQRSPTKHSNENRKHQELLLAISSSSSPHFVNSARVEDLFSVTLSPSLMGSGGANNTDRYMYGASSPLLASLQSAVFSFLNDPVESICRRIPSFRIDPLKKAGSGSDRRKRSNNKKGGEGGSRKSSSSRNGGDAATNDSDDDNGSDVSDDENGAEGRNTTNGGGVQISKKKKDVNDDDDAFQHQRFDPATPIGVTRTLHGHRYKLSGEGVDRGVITVNSAYVTVRVTGVAMTNQQQQQDGAGSSSPTNGSTNNTAAAGGGGRRLNSSRFAHVQHHHLLRIPIADIVEVVLGSTSAGFIKTMEEAKTAARQVREEEEEEEASRIVSGEGRLRAARGGVPLRSSMVRPSSSGAALPPISRCAYTNPFLAVAPPSACSHDDGVGGTPCIGGVGRLVVGGNDATSASPYALRLRERVQRIAKEKLVLERRRARSSGVALGQPPTTNSNDDNDAEDGNGGSEPATPRINLFDVDRRDFPATAATAATTNGRGTATTDHADHQQQEMRALLAECGMNPRAMHSDIDAAAAAYGDDGEAATFSPTTGTTANHASDKYGQRHGSRTAVTAPCDSVDGLSQRYYQALTIVYCPDPAGQRAKLSSYFDPNLTQRDRQSGKNKGRASQLDHAMMYASDTASDLTTDFIPLREAYVSVVIDSKTEWNCIVAALSNHDAMRRVIPIRFAAPVPLAAALRSQAMDTVKRFILKMDGAGGGGMGSRANRRGSDDADEDVTPLLPPRLLPNSPLHSELRRDGAANSHQGSSSNNNSNGGSRLLFGNPLRRELLLREEAEAAAAMREEQRQRRAVYEARLAAEEEEEQRRRRRNGGTAATDDTTSLSGRPSSPPPLTAEELRELAIAETNLKILDSLESDEMTFCENFHVDPIVYTAAKRYVLSPHCRAMKSFESLTAVIDLDFYRLQQIVSFFEVRGWVRLHTVFKTKRAQQ